MLASGAAGDASPPSRGWQLTFALFGSRDDLPKLTTATFVGIMIAVTGNILISLALNLQKLAHKRVEARIRTRQTGQNGERTNDRNGSAGTPHGRRTGQHSLDETDEDRVHTSPIIPASTQTSPRPVETEPLIPFPPSPSPTTDYGTMSPSTSDRPPEEPIRPRRSAFLRLVPGWLRTKERHAPLQASFVPVDVVSENTTLHNQREGQKSTQKHNIIEEGNETAYLKSRLWWLGFLLMNIGEMGNFISYAWAPASVVAPLGTFALMANCVFAPFLLGERFRKRDLLGILIAIIGAVTVVLASNASDTRLDSDGLLRAISQPAFIVYSCVYFVGAIILATLSQHEIGRRWVFIDVGLCGLFGGFTVLSTKAISTLLTMGVVMFSSWITYPVLAVLIITGIGQIRYLNRALMRFDGKVVIPVQFVFFTLSAIIGSAILYGDFKKAKFHQIVTFLYGCAATFLGVFILSWASTTDQDDAEDASEVDPADGRSPASNDEPRSGFGTIGKRRRAALIIPSGARDAPILRSQHSAVSLLGLSPAQHLLLVHTPPREVPIHIQTQNGPDRRRTMSWLGDGRHHGESQAGSRDNSLVGRLRHGAGNRVGSLDHNIYR
ncbi:magnesium transporter NIPA-domain-containing protein [Lyophyllum atratum]|nr:magnesium transporter NIPA-domain-containing protein [Lyophyllum atratum]